MDWGFCWHSLIISSISWGLTYLIKQQCVWIKLLRKVFLDNNIYYFLVRGASIVKVTCELWLPVSSPGRLQTQCRCASSPSLHASHRWSPRHCERARTFVCVCGCVSWTPPADQTGRRKTLAVFLLHWPQMLLSAQRRRSSNFCPPLKTVLHDADSCSKQDFPLCSVLRVKTLWCICSFDCLATSHVQLDLLHQWTLSEEARAHTQKDLEVVPEVGKGKGAAADCFLVFIGTFEEVGEGKKRCGRWSRERTEGAEPGKIDGKEKVWTVKEEKNSTCAEIAIYCKGKKWGSE